MDRGETGQQRIASRTGAFLYEASRARTGVTRHHTTEFEITPERKKTIYDSGRQPRKKFLQTWDFSGYLRVPQR